MHQAGISKPLAVITLLLGLVTAEKALAGCQPVGTVGSGSAPCDVAIFIGSSGTCFVARGKGQDYYRACDSARDKVAAHAKARGFIDSVQPYGWAPVCGNEKYGTSPHAYLYAAYGGAVTAYAMDGYSARDALLYGTNRSLCRTFRIKN